MYKYSKLEKKNTTHMYNVCRPKMYTVINKVQCVLLKYISLTTNKCISMHTVS